MRSFFDSWASEQTRLGPAAVSIEYDDVLHWIPVRTSTRRTISWRSARRACADVLGQAPPLNRIPLARPTHPGSTQLGIPTIPSLGPGILPHCHGPNEFVAVDAVHEAARIYARIAIGYCQIEDD